MFEYDPRLNSILTEIEDYLTKQVPILISSLQVTTPAHGLILWYEDTSGDSKAPFIGVLDEPDANADPESLAFTYWCPLDEPNRNVVTTSFKDAKLDRITAEAYGLMMSANKTGRPLVDEGEILRPFRSMTHRVALRLNGIDWQEILPVAEGFIVVAIDPQGQWLLEDLSSSLPPSAFESLSSRGLVPVA